MSIRKIASDACFTTIVGIPVALAVLIGGGKLIVAIVRAVGGAG